MSEQYKTITQLDADGNSISVTECQYTTRGPASFKKWANCTICGLSFPQEEMTKAKGNFYCNKYRHYEMIGE